MCNTLYIQNFNYYICNPLFKCLIQVNRKRHGLSAKLQYNKIKMHFAKI